MMRLFAPVPPGVHPCNDYPDYRSTVKRAPRQPAIAIPHTTSELSAPRFGAQCLHAGSTDLTRVGGGMALGQRIIVHGRVVDERGRPQRHTLIELWQANAAGRYRHPGDTHDAPIDAHFTGSGQAVTDANGCYAFFTIEPGAYPWGNHANAWRPKHIHFSLCGATWASRLVTQMYFPGGPLQALDPIFMSVADAAARARLVAAFDLSRTLPGEAIAYRFDLVLRGPLETPWATPP